MYWFRDVTITGDNHARAVDDRAHAARSWRDLFRSATGVWQRARDSQEPGRLHLVGRPCPAAVTPDRADVGVDRH
jgi:hypothetical protein